MLLRCLSLLLLLLFAPAAHANKLMAAGAHGDVAKGSFAVRTTSEWNRLKQRPGKFQEVWTIDGERLNQLTFFGGVPAGQPLFHERDKKNNPLPKVPTDLLSIDIAPLLQSTYQTLGSAVNFEVTAQKPFDMNGRKGVRFEYRYVSPEDEVARMGEAVGAFHGGKLYLVTYEAPKVHFFNRDKAKFEDIASTLTIQPAK